MDRIKLVSHSTKDFETLLLTKGWSVNTNNFSIEPDYDDTSYHKVIYYIVIADDDNVSHLFYGNNSYKHVLETAHSFSCGGSLMSTYITTIPSGCIHQIDFSESGDFPPILEASEKSTVIVDGIIYEEPES